MPDCKIVLVSFGIYLVHMRTLNITDVSCMHILFLNALDVAALDLSTGAYNLLRIQNGEILMRVRVPKNNKNVNISI